MALNFPGPQPNVSALLEALAQGDASALRPLKQAAPPEAAGPAEAWLKGAIERADPADESGAEAIELLLKLEVPGCGTTIARALPHPNARVRDAAAHAIGELRHYPAIGKLRVARGDAALEAIEKMFQQKFYGGFWADLINRPRRGKDGARDWTEFEEFWKDEGSEALRPPLLPEECTPDRPIADFLDRLPGSHRVFERHGYRCVARIGKDIEECVAIEKESLGDGARLHGKDVEALLADLRVLAARLRDDEEQPPPLAAATDDVETLDAPPPQP